MKKGESPTLKACKGAEECIFYVSNSLKEDVYFRGLLVLENYMKTLYENTHVQDIFFLQSVFVQWDFMACQPVALVKKW